MTDRVRLSNRHPTETFVFDHEGVKYHASVGRFDDGSIAELFLNGGKVGSAASTISRDAAVVLSIALQHGVPLATIIDALTKYASGMPAGPVGIALKIADRPHVVER